MAEKLEMKKCKECGKMFVPRHKRQVYCDDVHYRPCPVCGKPVEAKYLSDPARVCSNECRKVLAQRTKDQLKSGTDSIETKPVESKAVAPTPVPVVKDEEVKVEADVDVKEDIVTSNDVEVPVSADESDYASQLRLTHKVKKYEGKAVLGFIPGHEYAVDVDKVDHVYNVTALYDFTAGKAVDLMMPVSSKTSFYRSFKNTDN